MFSSLKDHLLAALQQFLVFLLTTLPTPLPAPITQEDQITEVWDDKDWYVSSSGLLTRDPLWLWDPAHDHPENEWDIDPVYFGPTFEHAIKYLPLCKGFETAFERDKDGHFKQARGIYYVVDGISKVFMHDSLGNLGTSLVTRTDAFTQQQTDTTPNSVQGT
ncbi:hypothetical protein C8R45DRAFT_1109286 [Mycena sanguinolenta]|nr:hypothetical protein C8R45DRAFT_1109286 [Mycena sanguinolenta]